jgi:hypothetical protein
VSDLYGVRDAACPLSMRGGVSLFSVPVVSEGSLSCLGVRAGVCLGDVRARFSDGGGTREKLRIRSVEAAQPPQAPHHERHVGPERAVVPARAARFNTRVLLYLVSRKQTKPGLGLSFCAQSMRRRGNHSTGQATHVQ